MTFTIRPQLQSPVGYSIQREVTGQSRGESTKWLPREGQTNGRPRDDVVGYEHTDCLMQADDERKCFVNRPHLFDGDPTNCLTGASRIYRDQLFY